MLKISTKQKLDAMSLTTSSGVKAVAAELNTGGATAQKTAVGVSLVEIPQF
jgi:hypothetical protein